MTKVKKACTKQPYDTEAAALAAARATGQNAPSSARSPKAYRCDRCKKPNGQRAWHWANYRPGVRRQR